MLPGRAPLPTSQRHCARKMSSRHDASTCGRPNRSEVKNRAMGNRRVFYHVGGRMRKLPPMDEPRESVPGELEEVSPASTPQGIASGSGFELTKLSSLEDRVQKI